MNGKQIRDFLIDKKIYDPVSQQDEPTPYGKSQNTQRFDEKLNIL
jgi:hypothetical protein